MDTPAQETSGEVYRQWGRALRSELYRLCEDSPYDFADYSLLEDFPGASLDDLSIVAKTSQYVKDGITVHLQCAAGEENAHGEGKLSRNNINLVIPEHFDEEGTPVANRWLWIGIDEISGQIGFSLREIQPSREYVATVDQPSVDTQFTGSKLARLIEVDEMKTAAGCTDPLTRKEYNRALAILKSLSAEDAVKPSYIDEGL